MSSQCKMADGRAVYEATGDHDPAHNRLPDEKQAHDKVHAELFKLRRLLIFGEFFFPGLFTNGGNGDDYRIPFGDGKSGTGQADESPEYNEKRHDEGKNEQPIPDTSTRDCSHHG